MLQSRPRHRGAGGQSRLHRALQRLLPIAVAALVVTGAAAARAQTQTNSQSGHLRGGWYPWDPYQYRDYKRGVPILTGFDVEIERALARLMRGEILLA